MFVFFGAPVKGMSSIRLALVGALVVITFAGAQVAGLAAASYDQKTEAATAQAAINTAARSFDLQAGRVVAEGTPKAMVDPVVATEKGLASAPLPSATFFIDQGQIKALKQRAANINGLGSQLAAAEAQVEAQLHQKLLDTVQKLRDATTPARNVGLDPGAYTQFADDTTAAAANPATPNSIQKAIDTVAAKTAELQALTAQHLTALQALAAAKDDAHSALTAAQGALTQAQAIPVLKVSDNAAAITADATKLPGASSLADFRGLAADLWAQNTALHNLMDARQATFDLFAATKDHINRASAAGKDVSVDQAQLNALEPLMNAAGDLATLVNIKNQIQAVKNDVDAKYWQAIYGTGKVIVVSLAKEELMALQDGVVVLDTPITSGRPSMATVTGTFHIIFKRSPYCMSSWQGNPYPWQGCVGMQYAMEFEASGYFLHDAPWRSRYGPGTNTEANGTHGCVNVPRNASQMDFLYGWTPVGTTVIVLPGDFGS
jgi:lipoprotein-anchoring transpeptidase ErfK/SrfK